MVKPFSKLHTAISVDEDVATVLAIAPNPSGITQVVAFIAADLALAMSAILVWGDTNGLSVALKCCNSVDSDNIATAVNNQEMTLFEDLAKDYCSAHGMGWPFIDTSVNSRFAIAYGKMPIWQNKTQYPWWLLAGTQSILALGMANQGGGCQDLYDLEHLNMDQLWGAPGGAGVLTGPAALARFYKREAAGQDTTKGLKFYPADDSDKPITKALTTTQKSTSSSSGAAIGLGAALLALKFLV